MKAFDESVLGDLGLEDESRAGNSTGDQSFLHEAQREGRASGKIELGNLDEALGQVTNILHTDVAEQYRSQDEEAWPTCVLSLYCHDCREIVPPAEGKGYRGKARLVCGKCGSKKVSKGRESVLRRFYHIKSSEESAREKPSES